MGGPIGSLACELMCGSTFPLAGNISKHGILSQRDQVHMHCACACVMVCDWSFKIAEKFLHPGFAMTVGVIATIHSEQIVLAPVGIEAHHASLTAVNM